MSHEKLDGDGLTFNGHGDVFHDHAHVGHSVTRVMRHQFANTWDQQAVVRFILAYLLMIEAEDDDGL